VEGSTAAASIYMQAVQGQYRALTVEDTKAGNVYSGGKKGRESLHRHFRGGLHSIDHPQTVSHASAAACFCTYSEHQESESRCMRHSLQVSWYSSNFLKRMTAHKQKSFIFNFIFYYLLKE
jgi:hypothetical protein